MGLQVAVVADDRTPDRGSLQRRTDPALNVSFRYQTGIALDGYSA